MDRDRSRLELQAQGASVPLLIGHRIWSPCCRIGRVAWRLSGWSTVVTGVATWGVERSGRGRGGRDCLQVGGGVKDYTDRIFPPTLCLQRSRRLHREGEHYRDFCLVFTQNRLTLHHSRFVRITDP
jgi:hypothetical protein